jgi:hypothetical protein
LSSTTGSPLQNWAALPEKPELLPGAVSLHPVNRAFEPAAALRDCGPVRQLLGIIGIARIDFIQEWSKDVRNRSPGLQSHYSHRCRLENDHLIPEEVHDGSKQGRYSMTSVRKAD